MARSRRVRAVREEGQYAPPAEVGQTMGIGGAVVQGRLIELEVSAVQQRAGRRVNGERHRVGNAVGDLDELHVQSGDRDGFGWGYGNEPPRGIAAVLGEPALEQSQSEPRSIDRTLDQIPDVGDGADVVLVTVGQKQSRQRPDLAGERAHVGDDQVDAEVLGPREHDTGIQQQVGGSATDGHHVHAELADAAQENDLDGR